MIISQRAVTFLKSQIDVINNAVGTSASYSASFLFEFRQAILMLFTIYLSLYRQMAVSFYIFPSH
jgi:hypothetical protein